MLLPMKVEGMPMVSLSSAWYCCFVVVDVLLLLALLLMFC